MSIQDGRLLFFFFLFQFNTLQQRESFTIPYTQSCCLQIPVEREMQFDHAYAAGGLRHTAPERQVHRHAGTYICHTDTLFTNDDTDGRWRDGVGWIGTPRRHSWASVSCFPSHREKHQRSSFHFSIIIVLVHSVV